MTEKESGNMANGFVWDLDELYLGDEDPKIERDLEAVRDEAQKFVSTYKSKLHDEDMDAQTLLFAIQEYESIHEMAMKPYAFAYLCQASDLLDQKRSALFQRVREAWNEISEMLTFFPLELIGLPEELLKKLAKQSVLLPYRHFLLQKIHWKPYTLSEPEEKIIKGVSLSGRMAFISLYDELLASLSVPVEMEGEPKALSTDQALALLHSPDRTLRESAYQSLLQELAGQGLLFRSILNALILDHHLENLRRGHPSPMHKVSLADGVEEGLIEEITEVVEAHYPLARRYFRVKGRVMGLERLKNIDLMAPITDERMQIPFPRAQNLVLDAMEKLYPLLCSMARDFFEKAWIDAEIRKGKRSGAFCKCFSPSLHPFISMNYSGNFRDVAILAHELGHGIHYRLASTQSYVNFEPSPILAETASTFNEILLIQYLLKREEFQAQWPTIIASHMDGIMITVFRQNVLTRFEEAIHRKRRQKILTEEEICRLWWQENKRLYENDVEMMPTYQWGWTHVPHFIHRPFYCYSYIFGNLLAMTLHQNLQGRGEDFLQKIIHLLSSGASKSPMEMLTQVGLDLTQKSLWEQAFGYIEGLIKSLEIFEKRKNDD